MNAASTVRARRPVGWFRLKSGGLFYGTVPAGAEVVDAPDAVDAPVLEQPVDGSNGVDQVDTVPFVDEQLPQAAELGVVHEG